jgi:hypothetical protein
MVRAGDVLRAAFSLAWKCGTVTMAVSLIAVMFASPRRFPGFDLPKAGAPATAAILGAETRVRMELPPGELVAKYSLVDERGDQLVQVSYFREGGVLVGLGEAFPVRPDFSAGRDGRCDFSVKHNDADYNLKLYPNGLSAVTIRDPREGDWHQFGISSEGEFMSITPPPP